MIEEWRVEAAIEYLTDSPADAAEAKGQNVYMEEYKKALVADIMKERVRDNPQLPLAAQERDALSDPRYKMHINGMREAARNHELHKRKLISAEVTIAAWQTQESTSRAVLKMV